MGFCGHQLSTPLGLYTVAKANNFVTTSSRRRDIVQNSSQRNMALFPLSMPTNDKALHNVHILDFLHGKHIIT